MTKYYIILDKDNKVVKSFNEDQEQESLKYVEERPYLKRQEFITEDHPKSEISLGVKVKLPNGLPRDVCSMLPTVHPKYRRDNREQQ